MIRAKFSNTYDAKLKRIKRLPVLIGELVDASRKGDAYGLIDTFQQGVRDNDFELEPLSPVTVYLKRKQGMSKPETPLYGRGDEEKSSYINTFRVVKIRNGYRVRPRSAKHWTRRIRLSELLAIHENGATIRTRTGVRRIPARPAWSRAQKRFLMKMLGNRREESEEVKQALNDMIRTGSRRKAAAYLRSRRITERRANVSGD